jgi:hypothetical protein
MIERCKQALAKMALEPEWEAKFEPNSYGFRPGRSCHDAREAIFTSMRSEANPNMCLTLISKEPSTTSLRERYSLSYTPILCSEKR